MLVGPLLAALLLFPPAPLPAAQEAGAVSASAAASLKRVPAGTLIVKGAWSSASDTTTPVPEAGTLVGHLYRNPYFGLELPLAAGWTQRYQGPPPSDTGHYVLAQLRPADTSQGASGATVLIGAQDLFFTPTPARNALELVQQARQQLATTYTVEGAPRQVQVAGRAFIRLDYSSSAAGLHWSMLSTQVRCHALQFVFTSRDQQRLEHLIEAMNGMTWSATETRALPVCIPGYASSHNVRSRVEPFFTERRFNPIPVRLIIDARGQVQHIHFISAFPDQAKSITDALLQWRFRPYTMKGRAVEVETGILFGQGSQPGQLADRQ
jgi:hypothetical protein